MQQVISGFSWMLIVIPGVAKIILKLLLLQSWFPFVELSLIFEKKKNPFFFFCPIQILENTMNLHKDQFKY